MAYGSSVSIASFLEGFNFSSCKNVQQNSQIFSFIYIWYICHNALSWCWMGATVERFCWNYKFLCLGDGMFHVYASSKLKHFKVSRKDISCLVRDLLDLIRRSCMSMNGWWSDARKFSLIQVNRAKKYNSWSCYFSRKNWQKSIGYCWWYTFPRRFFNYGFLTKRYAVQCQ